jgi:hypothetical protein
VAVVSPELHIKEYGGVPPEAVPVIVTQPDPVREVSGPALAVGLVNTVMTIVSLATQPKKSTAVTE